MNDHDPNGTTDRDHPASPEKLRESFEHRIQHLDAATANRLRLMRRDALSSARRARSHWRPVGVASFAVLAVGLVWWMPRSTPPPATPAPIAADFGDAAMLDEDSDLYAWLGDAPVATGSQEEKPL